MIANALKRSDGNINYPGLIAAWSAKGKTNDDADRATLKDLTGNGHDITLNGFAFSGMSGYGGYTQNFNNFQSRRNSSLYKSENKITFSPIDIISETYCSVNIGERFYNPKKTILNIYNLPENDKTYLNITIKNVNGRDIRVLYINKNGIYNLDIVEFVDGATDRNLIFTLYNPISTDGITIEQVPEYPDALVFDGVNDYGINENMPILTDYTIIAKRKTNDGLGALLSKAENTANAFVFEGGSRFISNTFSFGFGTKMDIINSDISYQSKNKYNGITIGVGSAIDTNKIVLGKFRFWQGAFYSAYLFDRSLDKQEIKAFIRKYIDPEYLLPSEIPTPDCYYDFSKGSNDDENRETIKDYSGNGNDAVAHNFAWRGMSGYGGYNCYFSSNSGVDRYEGSFTNDKAHITKIIDEVNKNLINIYIINNFNIKISGITGNNLVRIGPPNVATLSLSNGTHKIDSSLFPEGYNYSIGILGDIGECDITIEFIPEYPGALVFDGVDDYISLDAFNSGFKTMFMLCANFTKVNNILYDQRSATFNKNFAIYNATSIAYSVSNINGTYINGILNTKLKCSELINKKHLIHVVTNDISESRKPNIGRSLGQNQYSIMALYKFLGFKEALTEEQIQTVIKKYNLLDGVDEIEVS